MKTFAPPIVSLVVFVSSLWITNYMTNALNVAWVYGAADFDREIYGRIIESEVNRLRRGSTYKVRYTFLDEGKEYRSDIASFI